MGILGNSPKLLSLVMEMTKGTVALGLTASGNSSLVIPDTLGQ
jgi:hypothetical protein